MFTIKKFDAGCAVVELPDQTTINMPCQLLPEGARESDIIDIRINRVETIRRLGGLKDKKSPANLMN